MQALKNPLREKYLSIKILEIKESKKNQEPSPLFFPNTDN